METKFDTCSIPIAHEETPLPEVKDQSEPDPEIIDEKPQKIDPVELPGDEGTTSDGQAEQGTPLTETTVSQQDFFYLGLHATKPVFRVFEKARLKPVSSASQTI